MTCRRIGFVHQVAIRAVVGFALGAFSVAPAWAQPSLGTLARDRIELAADSSEPIVAIYVVEGQTVTAGDALLRQDDAVIEAQFAQAEAQLDLAAARLAEILRGPRAEEVREAEARLAGAEALLLHEGQTLARIRRLTEADAAAVENLDVARARQAEARARRDQASAVLDALRAGATDEQIAQARAGHASAKAVVRGLRVRRERLVVRAPRDAVIDVLPYEVGERPLPGSPVMIVVAAGAPYARVFVPEPIRVHLHPGVEAVIQIDGLAQPFSGKIRSIAQEPAFTPYYALNRRDRGRLAYVAKIDLVDPDAAHLPSGVPVEVTFAGIQRRGRLR